jgi:putative ATP-dependent endonuclease of the OLD family
MRDLKPYSLKVSNYKCFGEEAQGFESIRPVNIIVGRNNVGKSTLLEVINHANIMMSLPEGLAHKGKIPGTTLSWLLTEDYVYNTLGEHLELRDELHDMQNRRLSEGRAFFKFSSHGYKFANYGAIRDGRLFESIDRNLFPRIISAFEQAIANPFAGYAYRRIAADRDIRPELDDHPYTDLKDESLSPNGEGATTIVERVLQNDQMLGMQHPASLIEQDLVRDLNLIYGPDAKFDGIEVKRRRNNSWEIFLEEK